MKCPECVSTAKSLQAIAETGEHPNTFGGQEIEAAAQAIVEVHQRLDCARSNLEDVRQQVGLARLIMRQPLHTVRELKEAIDEAYALLEKL